MSGIHKGLVTQMKECSPLAIYINCYGHLLKLAIQDSITRIQPLRKAQGLIQILHNYIETSTKQHGIFSDIQMAEKPITMSLKSLCVTR